MSKTLKVQDLIQGKKYIDDRTTEVFIDSNGYVRIFNSNVTYAIRPNSLFTEVVVKAEFKEVRCFYHKATKIYEFSTNFLDIDIADEHVEQDYKIVNDKLFVRDR